MGSKYAIDHVLTDISLGYKNDSYIADLLLPTLPVKDRSASHFVYGKEKFRTEDSKRGPGARSKEVTHSVTKSGVYYCEDHALKEFVTQEEIDEAPEGVDPMADATENVTEKHFINKEVEAATMLFDDSIITQGEALSGSDQWSDPNSDPVKKIRAAKQTIHASILRDPNTLMLGKQVFDILVDHPAIVERVKYSQLGVLTKELLARFFDVPNVIIGEAQYNNSVEGQTDSMSYIWGKNALLAYVNPKLGKKDVTLGMTYQWKSRITETLEGVDERDRRGKFVRVGDHYYDQEIMAAGAGYRFETVVA